MHTITTTTALQEFVLLQADNALILGHRLGEWCGHGPVLEQDIAITNIALDLIGQARGWYQYAAKLMGEDLKEDDLAYWRNDQDFRNALLLEQPNGHWGTTIVRQFFFDVYNHLLHQRLMQSSDPQVAAIATKSIKEVAYHEKFSSEWMIRLGDGTEESHAKMQEAIDQLYEFTAELYTPTAYEQEVGAVFPGQETLKEDFLAKINDILAQATLTLPDGKFRKGGKTGRHSEHLGFILAEMQHLHRSHPGATW